MRLACSTASFPQDRLQIAVAKVAWAGFRAVEIALGTEGLPDEENLRSRLRADELELAAIHAGVLPTSGDDRGGGEPTDETVEAIARVGRAAALTRSLDGSVLVLSSPESGTLEAFARSLTLLSSALGDLAVDLCVAHRRGTLVATREDLDALWGNGLPERVRPVLDPAEAVLAGWDPAAPLPRAPGHVYLKDASGDRVVPPGSGEIDWPELIAALRRDGYAGSLSLVLENADPWAVEPAAREACALASTWLLG